jgi:hypothetical protein
MTGTTPIQLAPARRRVGRGALRQVARGAGALHLVLAAAIVLGVFAQVYLIGAYVFGAGAGALDAHRSAGFSVHGLEVLVLVCALVARLPRADRALSLLLALVGTAQIALASSSRWVGGLHPLFALVVLGLAVALARRGVRRRRDARAALR